MATKLVTEPFIRFQIFSENIAEKFLKNMFCCHQGLVYLEILLGNMSSCHQGLVYLEIHLENMYIVAIKVSFTSKYFWETCFVAISYRLSSLMNSQNIEIHPGNQFCCHHCLVYLKIFWEKIQIVIDFHSNYQKI